MTDVALPTLVYLIHGQGGKATSLGIDWMAAEINKIKGTRVKVFDWGDWQSIVRDIYTKPVKSHIILIGYSLGANATEWIQQVLKTGSLQGNHIVSKLVPGYSIGLLVAMDPSIWTVSVPLLSNVRHALLFHNVNPVNVVGHADLVAGTGFNPSNLRVVTTWDLHWSPIPGTDVDTDPYNRQIVIAAVKAELENKQ